MKKLFVAASILILFLYTNVCASAESYIVKFKNGYCPNVSEYNLVTINAEKGLYTAESTTWAFKETEYIEYICPDSEAFLIEGEEAALPFSLSDIEEVYCNQFELINADLGWQMASYGNDIIVGVIDSGCYPHEELVENIIPGKNYLDNNNDTSDDVGHGTHVSGIIAAKIGNGGVKGVAPKAKIVPLKCFANGRSATTSILASAIYDAVDVYNCRIINMSWGLKSDNTALRLALEYAYSKGVVLIASVGNYNGTTIYYPAGYGNVIGVGSVNTEKVKSEFSQYNSSVTVVSPGELVRSTYNNGGFAYMSGTSQSAPMVSGIAAVALSVNGKLSNAEIRKLFEETSEDLGDAGYDVVFGHGLVNEKSFINKLLENVESYVSPINISGDEVYVKIMNNTDKPLVAESIFSRYSQNKFLSGISSEVSVEPGESVTVSTDNDAEDIRHFLWNSLGDLKPVAVGRK